MKRSLPLLLLLLLPCLFWPGAVPGPRVVSADDHLSVHHAFQDAPGGHVRHPHLSDPALQLDALRERVVLALRAGRMPFWNPDIYGGAPLLADGQSMVGSPVTWFHALLAEDSAQDLGAWWVLAWTGLGTALLAGRFVGPWPAAVAGAAAMTGPYPWVWLLHPHAASFCWLPWLLLGLERRPWLAALATAGLVGGGHPATVASGAGLALAWWLVRKRDAQGILAMGAGALLATPLWVPLAFEAARSTTLAARGGQVLAPSAFLDLVWPGWWGHPAAETWHGQGSWADGQLHPGPGALALAVLGLRDRRGRWLWAAWAVALVLALLPLPGPFPSSRLGAMGALFVALAAGIGAARLRGRAVGLAFAVVAASGWWARHLDQGTLPAEQHHPAPAAWTARLREAAGEGRVLGLGWALQPNTGALAGVRDLRGYDLPVSLDTHRLMAALDPRPRGPWYPVDTLPSLHLLRFAGVRVVLGTEPGPELLPLDLGGPLLAWAVDDPAPRAWLAPAAEAVSGPDEAIRRISEADRRARPPVEGADLDGEGSAVPLVLREPRPEELVVEVGGAGLVVVADAWAPGWTATADGVPTPVLRVGGAFRGVLLRQPAATVVLRYRPPGWSLGLVLLALGLALTALLRWPGARRCYPRSPR